MSAPIAFPPFLQQGDRGFNFLGLEAIAFLEK
jgi:hypothetical protein